MTLAALGGSPVLDPQRHAKWPEVTDADKAAVMRVLDRAVLSGSDAPEARALQEEFAKAQGTKFALLTHSGTSALQVAVGALGIGEGDEVIVPSYSFVATALAVVSQGAIPIFVDVHPDSGNMDASKIEAAISPRTKAIMPVHVHGTPCDLGPIAAIAKKHNLSLIEDAAQAHLATYEGKPVGGFGRGAGFSLQSSKNLSAGEGGLYVTNEEALFERANQVRNFAQNIVRADAAAYDSNRPLDGHRALVSFGVGSMYRGNEMMAAFTRSQLSRLPEKTARAQENGHRLAKALRELPGVSPQVIPSDRTTVFHKYRVWLDPKAAGVDLPPAKLRDATIAALRAEGCEVVLWQGATLPSFPLFSELKGFGKGFPFSAGDVERCRANYSAKYDGATKLLESSLVLFSQTCPLIAQTAETVDLYAEAFRKVWSNRAQLVELAKKS
jgi:dTDP-4-amino-4,6-dideoxygalactose transaminase